MRKTVVWIGALAAVVTILDWLERSAWLRLLPGAVVGVFPLVFNLCVLAVVAVGVVKIAGLERQRRADHEADDAEHQDLRRKVGQLETHLLEEMNKTFVAVRRPIEQRLDGLEKRMTATPEAPKEVRVCTYCHKVLRPGEEYLKVPHAPQEIAHPACYAEGNRTGSFLPLGSG